MIPAEKITAAIQRLEQLKADSTPGRWVHGGAWQAPHMFGDVTYRRINAAAGRAFDKTVFSTDGHVNGADGDRMALADIVLTTTLHRTMDAQLAMLREAERTFTSRADQGVLNALIEHDCMHRWDGHIKLADAILGES